MHAAKINIQLNRCMRVISGCIKATPIQWLPVLTNIMPPSIRRQQALVSTIDKSLSFDNSILANLMREVPNQSLSRKPPFITYQELKANNFNPLDKWKMEWSASVPDNGFLILDPTQKLDGFNLPRRQWVTLNRIRTGRGRCGQTLHKWGLAADASCDCGAPVQTIDHIVSSCYLRKFDGSLDDINKCTPEAVQWMEDLNIVL